MRAFDKLKEANYHLDSAKQALIKIKAFKKKPTSEMMDAFRFEINAFIYTARMVTWVLIKDLKPTFKNKFEEWYDIKKKKMLENTTSKYFLDTRNTLEKEGNIVPLIRLEFAPPEANIILCVDYDPSSLKEKRLIKTEIKFIKDKEVDKTSLQDDQDSITKATFVKIEEILKRKDNYNYLGFKLFLTFESALSTNINPYNNPVEPDQLITECEKHTFVLQQILSEALKEFPPLPISMI